MKLSALSSQLSEGLRSTKDFVVSRWASLGFGLVILTTLPAFASSPLAMRVDVQPTAIAADGTVTTLEVQLAPSDRGRIGRQARLRIKLFLGTKPVVHILQDIDFDDQGSSRVEHTWPPGTYRLSLTIEGLRGTTQGFWEGEIQIPENLNPAPAPAPAPAPETIEPQSQPSVRSENPPTPPPPPEAVAPIATTAPVVTSRKVEENKPTPTAETTNAVSPPGEVPTTTPKSTPVAAEPPPPIPATEPITVAAPAAQPTPAPPATASPPIPTPRPVATSPPDPSGPVYALVLDIDPSDFEVSDRAAGLRASIDHNTVNVAPLVVQPGDPDPTVAIGRALKILRPTSEPQAIVVLSDVRRKAPRSKWKEIEALVQASGLPVFVIGLWNDQSHPGTRKQFKNLATGSGGRSYQLQPSESPARVLEMLNPVLAPGT